MRVLFKKPKEQPVEMEIENELKKLQELVGGYIETVPANSDRTILMVINEEGKLIGLEPNVSYGLNDYIAGNIIFVSFDGDGEFHGLTDEQVEEINELFA